MTDGHWSHEIHRQTERLAAACAVAAPAGAEGRRGAQLAEVGAPTPPSSVARVSREELIWRHVDLTSKPIALRHTVNQSNVTTGWCPREAEGTVDDESGQRGLLLVPPLMTASVGEGEWVWPGLLRLRTSTNSMPPSSHAVAAPTGTSAYHAGTSPSPFEGGAIGAFTLLAADHGAADAISTQVHALLHDSLRAFGYFRRGDLDDQLLILGAQVLRPRSRSSRRQDRQAARRAARGRRRDARRPRASFHRRLQSATNCLTPQLGA